MNSNVLNNINKTTFGLVRYDIIDEATDKVCDCFYELDSSRISAQRAIDYTLHKGCFHVLSKEDFESAIRIKNNG